MRAPPELTSCPTRSRLLSSSRERLAQINREAEERKRQALGIKEEVPAKPLHDAKILGAARASAKLAGGVFYTHAEHAELFARMKQLKNDKEALEQKMVKLHELEAYVASLVAPCTAEEEVEIG